MVGGCDMKVVEVERSRHLEDGDGGEAVRCVVYCGGDAGVVVVVGGDGREGEESVGGEGNTVVLDLRHPSRGACMDLKGGNSGEGVCQKREGGCDEGGGACDDSSLLQTHHEHHSEIKHVNNY